MSLRNDVPMLVKEWRSKQDTLAHNEELFNIFEGDLLQYVLKAMREQLSPDSYNQAKHRVAPINVLKRLVEKLSKIYAKPPVRELEAAVEKDENIFKFYVDSMDFNTAATLANEFFNLFKNSFVEPYLDEGKPKARVIPSHQFFVVSNNRVNPLKPTHLVKIMGTYKDTDGSKRVIFYAYTDTEFLIFNDDEKVLEEEMLKVFFDTPDQYGINPYGKIPGVYINRSRHELCPKIDSDTLCMTKLIPILLTDLNYAVMFQSFSIIYGIDIDEENLKMNPNAFWRFKSDPTKEGSKPEVGVIKPEVDSEKVLGLIQAQLAFWLNSRNIKPGTIGAINAQDSTSGISKMIDEMDTSEDRQKQVTFFSEFETAWWDLIFNYIHPVWATYQDFENKLSFSKSIKVTTTFAEQRPLVDRSVQIDDEIKMINAKLQDRRGALKDLYPDMSDDLIDEKINAIDQALLAETPSTDGVILDDETQVDPVKPEGEKPTVN